MRPLTPALLVLTACGGSIEPTRIAVDPTRPVCGWDALPSQAPVIGLDESDPTPSGATAGGIARLEVEGSTPFGRVEEALIPHLPHLVRLKVTLADRWLLPLTVVGSQRPVPPPKGPKEEIVVGHRRVIRPRAAPRVRFADVRLDGRRVELYVEHGRGAGQRMKLDELAGALRGIEPPVDAFALTATDDTPFGAFERALVATACYDRGPGEEPHEVLLDEREAPDNP